MRFVRVLCVVAAAAASLGLVTVQVPAIDLFGALGVPRVTQEQFRFLHDADAVLVVDVRSAGAFGGGHIPGAISVPLGDVRTRAAEIARLAAGKRVVTYCACSAEQTSAEAGRRLIQANVPGVAALAGGLRAWIERGGDVERGG